MKQPVLIAGAVGALARYHEFTLACCKTIAPAGTDIQFSKGIAVAEGRNNLAQQALDRKFRWVWFVDDDHSWAPDTLMNLLAHQKQIVAPVNLQKRPPYKPTIYESAEIRDGILGFNVVELPDDKQGLIPIHAAGGAGLLVACKVFEQMEPPWFEVGKLTTDGLGEDVWFCHKAQQAGIQVYCDLNQRMDHYTTFGIRPSRREDGTWVTHLVPPGGGKNWYEVDKARKGDAA